MSDRRLLFYFRESDFDLICDIGDDKDGYLQRNSVF